MKYTLVANHRFVFNVEGAGTLIAKRSGTEFFRKGFANLREAVEKAYTMAFEVERTGTCAEFEAWLEDTEGRAEE